MKTTQKNVREYLAYNPSVDCTNWSVDDYNRFHDEEGRFFPIAYSVGVYGCNGKVFQGKKTGTYYVVPSRSSALFLFSW